ncbi:unnamed protein product [Fraxinus pennsylvanica]|uniref:peptidylprolyl isomerase n=1 Tax=Fraxinus pennsylvanica TaxID=56036 RepID=A0AAD1ZVU2_9LAMI|nr:unnamed protein product [Fraxinus pennsylvanica]
MKGSSQLFEKDRAEESPSSVSASQTSTTRHNWAHVIACGAFLRAAATFLVAFSSTSFQNWNDFGRTAEFVFDVKKTCAAPLEIKVNGQHELFYGETLEVGPYKAQTTLPFNAFGAMAMARECLSCPMSEVMRLRVFYMASRTFLILENPSSTCFFFCSSCLPAIKMAVKLKLIPDIAPRELGWTCKVVVVEKTSSRTSQKGNGTYQHLWLMDTVENKVQATIFGQNIKALESTLVPSRTYLILNAYVKSTDE